MQIQESCHVLFHRPLPPSLALSPSLRYSGSSVVARSRRERRLISKPATQRPPPPSVNGPGRTIGAAWLDSPLINPLALAGLREEGDAGRRRENKATCSSHTHTYSRYVSDIKKKNPTAGSEVFFSYSKLNTIPRLEGENDEGCGVLEMIRVCWKVIYFRVLMIFYDFWLWCVLISSDVPGRQGKRVEAGPRLSQGKNANNE